MGQRDGAVEIGKRYFDKLKHDDLKHVVSGSSPVTPRTPTPREAKHHYSDGREMHYVPPERVDVGAAEVKARICRPTFDRCAAEATIAVLADRLALTERRLAAARDAMERSEAQFSMDVRASQARERFFAELRQIVFGMPEKPWPLLDEEKLQGEERHMLETLREHFAPKPPEKVKRKGKR